MTLASVYDELQFFLMHHTLLAPVVYLLFHVIFAICIIPCSPMAVIAGALWGKWLGLGISIVGAFVSSCTTFALSRFFLKDKIYQFMFKRYSKTDWFLRETQKHGWKFVASVQLNPAAPGSVLGYLFGLSNIDFPVYAFFLLLFMLPLQILLVLCGDSFPMLLNKTFFWGLAIAMVIVLICLIYGLKYGKKSK